MSLRCLDSGTPNLKDAAFAYEQLILEFGEPLLGSLAAIKVVAYTAMHSHPCIFVATWSPHNHAINQCFQHPPSPPLAGLG